MRGLPKSIKSVCGCCQLQRYKHARENSISVILAFLTLFPVNFQSAWVSQLWHHMGVPLCLPLSLTIPPIFGSERKGIPDDDSKATAAKGEFSPHLFYVCACLLGAYRCVHYLPALKMGVIICRESHMVTWFLQLHEITASLQKKWHAEWRCLSIYNLLLLAATTVKNALRCTCMLLIGNLFSP